MRNRRILVLGMIVVLAVGFGLGVSAGLLGGMRASGQVPMLIPYQGLLEKDGVLVNAIGDTKVHFRVALYDAVDGGNKVWPEDPDAFDEHAVNVYNGRFALRIGSDVPYQHVANTNLYLDIQVSEDGSDFTSLSSRQRLLSAPYAVSASRAEGNFYVPTAVGVGTTEPYKQITISGDGDLGGSMPEWLPDDAESKGLAVHWGSDHAFFGLKDREPAGVDDDAKDTVLYFGDDPDDSLVVESQDAGAIARFQGDGAVDLLHDVNVAGKLTYKGQPPFRFATYGPLVTSQTATGESTANWFAVVAGFSAENGDIDENGSKPVVVRCRMVDIGNSWYIQADIASHSTNEYWIVNVLYIRKDLIEFM